MTTILHALARDLAELERHRSTSTPHGGPSGRVLPAARGRPGRDRPPGRRARGRVSRLKTRPARRPGHRGTPSPTAQGSPAGPMLPPARRPDAKRPASSAASSTPSRCPPRSPHTCAATLTRSTPSSHGTDTVSRFPPLTARVLSECEGRGPLLSRKAAAGPKGPPLAWPSDQLSRPCSYARARTQAAGDR